MKQIRKDSQKTVFNSAFIRFGNLIHQRKSSPVGRWPKIICKPLLLLSISLSVPMVSVAETGAGVALANNLLGTFGEATETMKAGITQRIEDTGLEDAAIEAQTALAGLADGVIPVIGDLTDPFQDKVDETMAKALAKAQIATNILNKLNGENAKKAIEYIAGSPLFADADFGLTLPSGRVRVYRKGLEVSICRTTVGPLGSIVISGISNARQLCHINEPRMANPTKSLLAFVDIAAGHSHFRANTILIPNLASDLTQLPAPIDAETYVKIHDQWVQIKLAGADPKSMEIEAKFEVGIKGGVSYAVEAEVEGEAALKIKLKPLYAAEVIRSTAGVMFDKATSLGLDMNLGNVPYDTATILKAGLQHLGDIEGQYEGGFGETSIDVKLTGGIGVGIWDTGIAGISAGGSLNMTYPLDALISISSGTLERYLDIALGMNDANLRLATAIMEGNAGSGLDGFKEDARAASRVFVDGVLNDLLAASTHITLASSFKLTALGDADKESIELYESGLVVPVGEISSNLQTNPNALGDALAAAAYLLLSSIDPDAVITDQTWTDLQQVVVPGILYTLKVRNPLTAALIGFDDVGLLETIQTIATIRGILINVVKSAQEGSLTSLRTAIENTLNSTSEPVINLIKKLIIPRLTDLGANGALGAEVVGELGASIGIEGEVKASLVMLLLGLPQYQEEDETVLARSSVPINVSLDGGASVGEGVEMTVDAGGALSLNLFELTAKHWDGPLPTPATMHVAGFPVLEFDGTINGDESFSGTGFLMLPMGGIVSAEFSVDSYGNVISGSWEGGMDLGPLGKFTFISGALDNDGIHGSVKVNLFSSQAEANFILASNGMLFGSYDGSLNIAGQELAAVSMYLGTDGEFSGQYTGSLDIGGFNTNTDLSINNDSFSGSGTLNILGSNLTASDIFISRSGKVSGSFAGTIQAGDHTLSNVSLRVVNGGLVGTAMMDLPGALGVEVDLQVINGKVTATYSGDFLNGLSSQASMFITNTGIILSSSMNTSMLSTATSQVIDSLVNAAQDSQFLLPAAEAAVQVADGLVKTAFAALDPDNVAILVQPLINAASGAINIATNAVTEAQKAVDTAQAALDYAKSWGLPTSALQTTLNEANAWLQNRKTNLKNIENKLAQDIQDLKDGLQQTYDDYYDDWSKKVTYVNQLLAMISVLDVDSGSLFSVQSVSFTADLNALLSGSNIEASSRMMFMGQQGRITLSLNLGNPAESFYVTTQALLFGQLQLTNTDNLAPEVIAESPAEWQSGGVLVQLLASDNEKVASITYSASGAQTIASKTVAGDTASILIDAEGMTSLSFYATDTSGNVSATTTFTTSIDNGLPQINIVTPGNSTLNPYDIEVSANDLQGSGVSYLLVSAFGAETINEYVVNADSTVVSLTQPGTTMLSITAVDVAGNSTTITQMMNVPVLTTISDGEPAGTDTGSGGGGGSLGLLWLLLISAVLWARTLRQHQGSLPGKYRLEDSVHKCN